MLLQENTGKNLCDAGLRNVFIDMIPKTQIATKNRYKLDFIKI